MTGLRKLCTMPAETLWPLAVAVETFKEQQWAEHAEKILEQSLELPAASCRMSGVTGCYSRRRTDIGRLGNGWKSSARGAIGELATQAFIRVLANNELTVKFHRFVRQNEPWLCVNTQTWGAVGWASTSL